MKRRNFLGLIGAAVAAPLMPVPNMGQAAGAVYSSGRWASSKILQKEMLGAVEAAKRTQVSHRTQTKTYAEPDLGRLIAHLRGLCAAQGMPLSPACAV